MKTAALPAAETLETRNVAESHLRLVGLREEPRSSQPFPAAYDEATEVEDPDDMWDNLPV